MNGNTSTPKYKTSFEKGMQVFPAIIDLNYKVKG